MRAHGLHTALAAMGGPSRKGLSIYSPAWSQDVETRRGFCRVIIRRYGRPPTRSIGRSGSDQPSELRRPTASASGTVSSRSPSPSDYEAARPVWPLHLSQKAKRAVPRHPLCRLGDIRFDQRSIAKAVPMKSTGPKSLSYFLSPHRGITFHSRVESKKANKTRLTITTPGRHRSGRRPRP
jgi:hypothetical protein